MDSAIHWINLYPVNGAIGFPNTVEPNGENVAVLTGDRVNAGFCYKKIYGRFAARPKKVAVITR